MHADPSVGYTSRSLQQLSSDIATVQLEAARELTGGIAEVLDSTQDIIKATQAIATLKAISGAAGFLAPVLEMALAFAGFGSQTDQLLMEGFRQINEKLDKLSVKIDEATQEVGAHVVAFGVPLQMLLSFLSAHQ